MIAVFTILVSVIIVMIAFGTSSNKTSTSYEWHQLERQVPKAETINSIMREIWNPLRIVLKQYKTASEARNDRLASARNGRLVFRNKSTSEVYLFFLAVERGIGRPCEWVYKYQNGRFQFEGILYPDPDSCLDSTEARVFDIGGYHRYEHHYYWNIDFSDWENINIRCGYQVWRSLSESKWHELD